jgi:putative transposase
MASPTRKVRQELSDQLLALRSQGRLTAAHKKAAAQILDCSPRTVMRDLERGAPPDFQRAHWVPEAKDLEVYWANSGDATAVYEARKAAGEPGPGLRTIQRAFARELNSFERADAAGGARARRDKQLHVHRQPQHRNETWEGDHFQIGIPVILPRHQRPLFPWVTWWIDAYTRALMSWVLSVVAATSAQVLDSLKLGIEVDPDRGPFSGVPFALRVDNGKEFRAGAVERAALAVGTTLEFTAPYSPYHKGRIERVHRTFDQHYFRSAPGWKGGARTRAGRRYSHAPWTMERFVAEFDAWVRDYNTARPHRALEGMTPLEAWDGDPTPLRHPPAHVLRGLSQAHERRKVQKDGIHFAGLTYFASELHGLVGESVEVGYVPHDRRKIDVYRSGEFLATCQPQELVSEHEREALFARRQADAERLRDLRSRAERRKRVRLSSITGPAPLEETTVASREEVRRETGPVSDAALRRAAAADLLRLEGEDGAR